MPRKKKIDTVEEPMKKEKKPNDAILSLSDESETSKTKKNKISKEKKDSTKKSKVEKEKSVSKKSTTKRAKEISSENIKLEEVDKKTTSKKAILKAPAKTKTSKSSTTSTSKSKKSSSKSDKDEDAKKEKVSKASVSSKKTTKSPTKHIKKEETKKAPKTVAKKETTKKTTSSRSRKKDSSPIIDVVEYYDLPYRYNQTLVKILYQTPDILFIYWDISDKDRLDLVNQYGNDFFNNTRPVLIIHNHTMNYSFEIEIDDFANSWYLHINDTNCEYSVELGRRPKYINNEKQMEIPNDYIFVTFSNEIESPNDHVLFDKNLTTVYFKNVKTNITTSYDTTSLSFMRNMGRIYNLFDLKTEFGRNNFEKWLYLNLTNPSSGNPTSTFK